MMAVYASLTPFQPVSMSIPEAVRRIDQHGLPPWGIDSRADWVANVLLFIPVGYLALGWLALDRSRRTAWLLASPIGAASGLLSASIEFTQAWFPARTVSRNDVLAEMLGAGLGVLLWLAVGQRTVKWLRGPTARLRSNRPIDWALRIYFLWLVIHLMSPLDFSISLTALYHKYKAGQILLVPFAGWREGNLTEVVSVVRDILLFVPVGFLAATTFTSRERPLRSWIGSLLLGMSAVVGMEIAQLFVVGRYVDVTDVLTCALGIVAGCWLARRLVGGAMTVVPSQPCDLSVVQSRRMETGR
ncbi:MAG: VanZ family protein [Pirellulales bacterium]|nr:VanZ family protein [Pirellulales bacterium]